MKCPNCGEDVKPTDKQCPNCHFDLEKFRNEFFTGQDTTRNEKNDDHGCRSYLRSIYDDKLQKQ